MRTSVWAFASLYAGFPLLAVAQHSHDHSQHDHGSPTAQRAASEHDQAHGHAADKPKGAPAQAPSMGSSALKQTTCPVTGEPVKADSFTTFEGRKVFFCCDDCIDKFKKAPAKYVPAFYKQVYPQRIQATCPVMGGAVDPEVSVEHEGQKVYFCCDGCDKKFEKDPAKYLPKLKESYTTQVHCPVTGHPIDLAHNLEERDRTVYFCSEACIAKYNTDPRKYAQALLPEVGVAAYGPTAKDDMVTAPVCPADKAPYKRSEVQAAVYQGKVYFLSSEACEKAFKADPAKHVRALNSSSEQPSRRLGRVLKAH